jgi:hypothetical protein
MSVPSKLVRPEPSKERNTKAPSARTLRGLDWLNFFLADVQTGVGPFLAIYLAGYKWDEERVGLAPKLRRAHWLIACDPNVL